MKSKKILVISTSQRECSNSDILSDQFIKGALSNNHQVNKISLVNKNIQYCHGCLICQKIGNCPIQDDMQEIIKQMHEVEVIVFATPVYFYNLCGQMKTLLDRSNPLFNRDYHFQDIYLIMSAAEEDDMAFEGSIRSLQGWIDCFDKSSLKGVIKGKGITDTSDVKQKVDLMKAAYCLGQSV